MQKLIAQGAEAKLFEKNSSITKHRFRKGYRIKEIDNRLRGFRTRREAKILQKLESINFPSPRLIKTDEKEKIIIEKIDGELLKDILEKNKTKKNFRQEIFFEIGNNIALLHNNKIIHGDLTTSNMILKDKKFTPICERGEPSSLAYYGKFFVYFIDFGLSFFSEKIEDKAVDLHLLKEGLEAKHNRIWKQCFKIITNTYIKEAKEGNEIIKRLRQVEKRGRYKQKN